jgi:hypothetical protein
VREAEQGLESCVAKYPQRDQCVECLVRVLWWPRVHLMEASCTKVSKRNLESGLNPRLHGGCATPH